MIGNDIVDLKYSASNWERPRFLDKAFTKKEQLLILSSENEHSTLWLLWSMKEAAYKIHVQQFVERFFNPKRLVCELISDASTMLSTSENGLVRIDNSIYFTTSTITEDYIYTIARLSALDSNFSSVLKTESASYRHQSNTLKKVALESISKTENLTFENLEIKKTTMGIPQVFYDNSKLSLPLSLTHCNRFAGFAY